MIEVVTAVYETASAAETAVEDLKVARVQSAVIRKFVNDNRVLAVTVEDRHAGAVMGVLGMQVPISMKEAPLPAG